MPQGLGILCKVFFFFNICNGDMYFDALITGLFQICLVMDQRGVCWCVEGEVGIQFGLGASEQPGKEFCLVGLGVGGCVQFLVKVLIFMGIGEAKRQKGRFEVIQKEQATKRGGHFLWSGVHCSPAYLTYSCFSGVAIYATCSDL